MTGWARAMSGDLKLQIMVEFDRKSSQRRSIYRIESIEFFLPPPAGWGETNWISYSGENGSVLNRR